MEVESQHSPSLLARDAISIAICKPGLPMSGSNANARGTNANVPGLCRRVVAAPIGACLWPSYRGRVPEGGWGRGPLGGTLGSALKPSSAMTSKNLMIASRS